MDASLKLNLIVKKFRSTLYSIINSTTRKILLSSFRSGEEGGGGGGGGIGGKCSHHCATNKCGPSSIPVLSVICGLSWLLVLVLAKGDFFQCLRLLRFSPLLKNHHFQIPIRSGFLSRTLIYLEPLAREIVQTYPVLLTWNKLLYCTFTKSWSPTSRFYLQI